MTEGRKKGNWETKSKRKRNDEEWKHWFKEWQKEEGKETERQKVREKRNDEE